MSQHQGMAQRQGRAATYAWKTADLTAQLGTEHTSGSFAAFGLKLSSWLLKRFIRLTGRLMSAVVTTSRQLRRTKAIQGSTNHSNSAKICRTEPLLKSSTSLACPGSLNELACMAMAAGHRLCRKWLAFVSSKPNPCVVLCLSPESAVCCSAPCSQAIARCQEASCYEVQW